MSSVGEDSVSLTWAPPRDNGGSHITGYLVEKREALRMSWQNVGVTQDLQMTVPHLAEGTQYVFRVSAQNEQGQSIPEELTRSIAAKPGHSKFGINMLHQCILRSFVLKGLI